MPYSPNYSEMAYKYVSIIEDFKNGKMDKLVEYCNNKKWNKLDLNVYLFGPSGSGKTYLAKKLQELYPDEFYKPIQCTTRPKRENEVEDIDYYFYEKGEIYLETNSRMKFTEKGKYYVSGSGILKNRVPKALIPQYELCCYTKVNGFDYGTRIEDLKEDKINIIVVDKLGYENRPKNKKGILIGLDYSYNKETDIDRVKGRENRDQRANFDSFIKEHSDDIDALLTNSSSSYLTPFQLRMWIYKIAFQNNWLNVCFKDLKKKEEK